jgi:hypothetical protein
MKESYVMEMLRCVWSGCRNGGWLGLNQSLHKALMLAVRAGFRFERDDFAAIERKFDFHRWGGAGAGPHGFAESFYSAACAENGEGNRSAAIAFEIWKKRPAFRYRGRRLAEGSVLSWRHGNEVFGLTVSSFSGDGSYLNAVWHREASREMRPAGKEPDRRFRITREELKREAKALEREDERQGAVQDPLPPPG